MIRKATETRLAGGRIDLSEVDCCTRRTRRELLWLWDAQPLETA